MPDPVQRHPSSEAEIFLRHLWPEMLEGSRLLIWSLADKRSYWQETVTLASSTATEIGQKENVYIGVGASGEDYGQSKRCKSSEVVAIPGVAADFDLANPLRKKPDLFESRSEIHDFIASLPLAPTVVVESGGGLQAWWLWEEIWELESEAERLDAEAVSRGWSRLLQSEAKQRRRSVDATWDLARVMRIPGTINHKYGRKVSLISDDGPRYNPSDFEAWKVASSASNDVEVGELVLLPDAHPPWDKFQALMELEPDFKVTWERKRKASSFPSGQNSASEYSMSLATQAALAGWEEQEIVDLVIAWRGLNGADLKLRQGWYRELLKKAIRHRESEETAQAIEHILNEAHQSRSADDDAATTVPEIDGSERNKILGLLRQRTGVHVEKVILYGSDDGQYSLVIKGGREVLLGEVKHLMDWYSWQVVAMQHGRLCQRPKAKAWADTLSGVQAILEVQEADDTTEQARVLSWLEEYLSDAVELSGREGLFSVLSMGDAFLEGGKHFFRLESFLGWIQMARKDRITPGRLRFRLTELGCTRKKLGARDEEDIITKRYLVFNGGNLNE